MTRSFQERARYYLLRGDGGSFVAERQWELADLQERRMLLAAVIDRVVIVSLDAGQEHPGRAGRRLRIEWKDEPEPVQPPPHAKGVKGSGRAKALARDQLDEVQAERAARSERSRRYFREWKQWCNQTNG